MYKHATNLDKCSTSHICINRMLSVQINYKFSQSREVLHKETKRGGRHLFTSYYNCRHHHLKWRRHRTGLPKNLVYFVSPVRPIFTSGLYVTNIKEVNINKMTFDFKSSRSKFFRSFNSIISKISKANEIVAVSLIKTNCIPILMYGVEALDLNKSMLYSLNNPLCLVF